MSVKAPVRWVTHGLNGAFVVRGSYLGSRYVPLPLGWPIAHTAAWLVGHGMTSIRDALVDNLRVVLPHESDAQLRRRAYRTCHTYTDDWMDFMRSLSWPREKVLERFTYEHPERLTDALSLGRGAILVTGHYGNWEAGSVMMKALGVPLTVVAMPEADPAVNAIRHRVREELLVDTLEVRQSLDTPLQIRRRLAEGRVVAMLMDRAVDRDRVPVTMFGRRVHFLGTPALLAYLTGAPLVPMFLVRQGRGRFRALPQEPILLDRQGDRAAQVQRTAQAVATLLERQIAERPECWYQFHRYWEEDGREPGNGNRETPGRAGTAGPTADGPNVHSADRTAEDRQTATDIGAAVPTADGRPAKADPGAQGPGPGAGGDS